MKIQDYFHIFLVEPEDSLNIGCVARAMLNCGFTNLHLVNPIEYNEEKAAWSACWGKNVLDNAKIHQDLLTALSDMTDVVGFSARTSRDRRNHFYLTPWVENLKTIPPNSKIALLFGNERTGLRNEHIDFCKSLIRIPSSEENPSYNLAQAVLLALFEIYKITLSEEKQVKIKGQIPADAGQLHYLEELITATLKQVQFYREDSSPAVRRIVKNLIRRMQPDQRELGILLAAFDALKRETKKTS